jgi:hypothetical protein
MLTGWDGRLTVLLRKRISRHIDDCDICGERKRRELTPAMFAGAVPVAALPALLSPGVREQVLHVLADRSEGGMAHRLSVANRAAPFGPHGFPTPASPPGAAPWRRVRHHPRAAVAAAAVAVIAAGAVVAGLLGGSHHRPPAGAAGGAAGGLAPGASASTRTPARGGPSGSHTGGGSGSNGRNGARGGRGPVPTAAANGGTATPVSVPSSIPASGAPTPVAASSHPAPTATGTSTAPASSSPSVTARPSTSAPAAGRLSLSTGTLRLVSVKGVATARFTITAQGGPVSYSITPGSSLAGSMTVSPSAGSLAAGASVTVTVTSTSLVAVDGTLTVNPGGQTIAVVLSVSP